MDKKGMEVGYVVCILIIVVVLIIVLFVFIRYGKSMVFGAEQKTEEEISQEMSVFYNNLVNEFKEKRQPGKCSRKHTDFPEGFEGYKITLTRDYDKKGTNIKLINRNGEQLKSDFIKDLAPCVVAGEGAVAFHDNWITEPYKTIKKDKDYAEFDYIEINYSKGALLEGVRLVFNNNVYYIEDKNLLYQADQNHICFIPTHGYRSFICESPKERYGFPPITSQNPDLILLRSCAGSIEENTPLCVSCSEVDDCLDYWPGYQCAEDPCKVGTGDPCFQVTYQNGSISLCKNASLWDCHFLNYNNCERFPNRCRWVGSASRGDCLGIS